MQHWGIFWRPFTFSFCRLSTVILVCMKLHNLYLDRQLDVPLHRFSEDVQAGDEWVVYNNYHDDDVLLCAFPSGDHRRDIRLISSPSTCLNAARNFKEEPSPKPL